MEVPLLLTEPVAPQNDAAVSAEVIIVVPEASMPKKDGDAETVSNMQKYLPETCYTVEGRYAELKGYFEISFEGRAGNPEVVVGNSRISVGRQCHSLCVRVGNTTTIRRAFLHFNKKTNTWVLENPGTGVFHRSYLIINCGMPHGYHLKSEDRPLRVHTGVSGKTLMHSNEHTLIALKDGESVNVFYPDGYVRKFRREDGVVAEAELSLVEMLKARLEEAHVQLNAARNMGVGGARMLKVRYILSGMADLLVLTTRYKGAGQEMRTTLLRELFVELPREERELVHKKFYAILAQHDPSLLPMIRGLDTTKAVTDPASPVEKFGEDKVKRTSKLEQEQKRVARAAADAAYRNEHKGKSGGKPVQHTTDPKKLAKQARRNAAKGKKK